MAFFPCKFYFASFIIPYLILCNAKTVPELKFRPKPTSLFETSLIWYKANDQGNVTAVTRDLDELLEGYKTPGLIPGRGQNLIICDYDRRPRDHEVCNVDVLEQSPCVQGNHYGYHRGTPCIFLVLDKMFGWEPEYYNNTDTLPAEMPEDLKASIGVQKRVNHLHANQLWVTCNGESPADNELMGPIQYFPRRGFPGYFFPFENKEGNLSPLVAIHFESPMLGIIINIECKLWARNLNNTQPEKQGVVNFELLID